MSTQTQSDKAAGKTRLSFVEIINRINDNRENINHINDLTALGIDAKLEHFVNARMSELSIRLVSDRNHAVFAVRAYCHPNDIFSRKMGNWTTVARLKDNITGQDGYYVTKLHKELEDARAARRLKSEKIANDARLLASI